MADEGGYVLLWAIFTFVIMTGLAVVGLRTASVERRVAKATAEWGESFYAAEAGRQQALGLFPDSSVVGLAPGDSIDLGWMALSPRTSYRPVLHRVDNNDGQELYVMRVTGRGSGLFAGRTDVMMSLIRDPVILSLPGAITAIDGTGPDAFIPTMSGNSFGVDGRDTQPLSASDPDDIAAGCPTTPSGENKLAVSLSSQTSSDEVDSELAPNQRDQFEVLLHGSTTNDYTSELSFDYNNGPGQAYNFTEADAVAMVTALTPDATTLPSGTWGTDLGTPTNPGIWIADDLDLGSYMEGFGVLIITGDLRIADYATWEGLILVVGDGNVQFTGSDSTVFGGIIVVNTNGGTTEMEVSGDSEIYYSSQALCMAALVMGDAGLRPLARRAWSQGF